MYIYKTFCYITAVPNASSLSSINMTLHPGENITLTCGYSGIPLPTLQWKKDNFILNETSQEIDISFNNVTSTIVVNSMRGTNGGIYTCEAINVVGASSRNYTIECKSKFKPLYNVCYD